MRLEIRHQDRAPQEARGEAGTSPGALRGEDARVGTRGK